MATLNPCPISISRFTRTGNVFAADMSEVALGRVYDDACDEGLTLVTDTGRMVVMGIEREHRDREGELQYLELRPVKNAECGFAIVHLYND